MERNNYEEYVSAALEMKAKDAKIIPAETVVVAQWVREKCQFGCGGYGKSLTCPPHSPTPEKTKDMLTHYEHALLIHGDMNTPLNKIVVELERKIFLAGYERAFGMGGGPCFLCQECVPSPGLCKHPEEARPSMEACGIDVYSTVKAHGFPIEVLKDQNCKPNFYGLVLIE
jgi:predicted metal-binding protein